MDRKVKILIVDDNESLRKTMNMILSHKGYAASTAPDGAQAIEKLQKDHFDLVFMDIKMPLMNGVEAYKLIKEIRPQTIVIMMTAYALEELVQEALDEGAFDVIYKPLDMDKVLALIEQALQDKKGHLILIVDDDANTCKLLEKILAVKGYHTQTAYTGTQAIEMVKNNQYQIMFLDMKLPPTNGLEVYLEIRKTNPDMVVILITGYYQDLSGLIEQAMNDSAYAYLQKPLDMDKLIQLVEQIFKSEINNRQL